MDKLKATKSGRTYAKFEVNLHVTHVQSWAFTVFLLLFLLAGMGLCGFEVDPREISNRLSIIVTWLEYPNRREGGT